MCVGYAVMCIDDVMYMLDMRCCVYIVCVHVIYATVMYKVVQIVLCEYCIWDVAYILYCLHDVYVACVHMVLCACWICSALYR